MGLMITLTPDHGKSNIQVGKERGVGTGRRVERCNDALSHDIHMSLFVISTDDTFGDLMTSESPPPRHTAISLIPSLHTKHCSTAKGI